MFLRIFFALLLIFWGQKSFAQYTNLPNAYIHAQNVAAQSIENSDKPIIYIFYNNEPCDACPQAAADAYNLIENHFAGMVNIFEIDYQEDGEFNFVLDYYLDQPLSLVFVKMQNGRAVSYEKIDNPQQWLNDEYYFNQQILSAVNNVLSE